MHKEKVFELLSSKMVVVSNPFFLQKKAFCHSKSFAVCELEKCKR